MPGCYICTIIVIIVVVEMVSHACTCWSNLSCDLRNIWIPLVDLGISVRKFHSFVVPELQSLDLPLFMWFIFTFNIEPSPAPA